MRKNTETKNVFCLEGLWDNNLKKRSTIEPVLQLLESRQTSKYIHKNCATTTELEFYLERWSLKAYSDYPILYLAFHGTENLVHLVDRAITLDKLAEILEDKCSGRIIIIGSCSTMNIDKRHLKNFVIKTDALALFGYKTDVDWVKSTANDLLVFEALQDNEFSLRGIDAILKKIKSITTSFKELEYRVITKKDI